MYRWCNDDITILSPFWLSVVSQSLFYSPFIRSVSTMIFDDVQVECSCQVASIIRVPGV